MTIVAIVQGIAVFDLRAFEPVEMQALSMVESGDNRLAKGKHGERTQYQIRPATWKQYTGLPFTPAYYHKPKNVEEFFYNYVSDIRYRFQHIVGRQPHRTELYAIWNMGWNGFKKKGFNTFICPKEVRDRIMRYENICKLLESKN